MLDNETKRRIDSARDILVGKIPDPKSQVEQITIALIYKFMDDMDRQSERLPRGKAKFFTGEFKKYAWRNILSPQNSGENVVILYGEALQKMNYNKNVPQLFRDIFKNAYLPYRDPETLKDFLKEINYFEYDHSERLGDAFEYLLSVLGSQGDAGQFRTPRNIIDFMVEIIEPKKNEKILDPACGTAGFLISAYKHIVKRNSKNYDPKNDPKPFELQDIKLSELTINGKGYRGEKLTSDDKKRLVENIIGYDISPDMVRLSLVNMYLHGFSNPHIFEYDTLSRDDKWDEKADVILANPPFMSPKGGIKPHSRFRLAQQTKRSEVLFVDYMAEHLTNKGCAAIIVPEGIIFQTSSAYKELRKMLVDEGYLAGVISLPAGLFNPYSGVKTSILWLDKTLAKKTDKILFVKIENDGFDLGAQRRPIKKNDLPDAYHAIMEYKENLIAGKDFDCARWQNISLVEKKKIAKGGEYNLSGERYKERKVYTGKWPIVKLKDVVLEMKDGGTPSRRHEEYFNGNIHWCVVKDIKPEIWDTTEKLSEDGLKNSSAKVWPVDSIIISLGATIGNVGIAKVPTATKQGLCGIVVDKSKILPKFIFYILSSQRERIQSFASGVTIKEVRPSRLKELFTLPLPPVSIQQEIVEELDSYQKIIDGARQVVENYKPHIDIDPKWPMVELGKIAEVIAGQSPEGKYYNQDGEGMPFYQGKTEFTDMYIGSPKKWTTKTTKEARNNDILMSVRAPVGPVNLATQKCCIGRGLAAIRAIKVKQMFLFYYLKSIENSIVGGGGSVFDSISRSQIEKIMVPMIPDKDQENIIARLTQEQKIVDSNKKFIEIFEQKIKDRIAKVWGEK